MKVRRQSRAARQREANPGGTALLEFLDRSLDKGVVIEGWARVPLLGIEVLSVDFGVFIASFEKYLEYAGAVEQAARVVALDALDDLDPEQLPPPQSPLQA